MRQCSSEFCSGSNTENEGQFGSFFREEVVMLFAHAKALVCIYCVGLQFWVYTVACVPVPVFV